MPSHFLQTKATRLFLIYIVIVLLAGNLVTSTCSNESHMFKNNQAIEANNKICYNMLKYMLKYVKIHPSVHVVCAT